VADKIKLAGGSDYTCANAEGYGECVSGAANPPLSAAEVICLKKTCKKSCNKCDFTDTTVNCVLSDLPQSCTPSTLRARGESCVHGYQCTSGFCCPDLRICLVNSVDGITKDEIVGTDTLAVLEDAGCFDTTSAGKVCSDTSGAKQNKCKNMDDGTPRIIDWDQSVCGCSTMYMQKYNSATWVPNCPGGTAPCPSNCCPGRDVTTACEKATYDMDLKGLSVAAVNAIKPAIKVGIAETLEVDVKAVTITTVAANRRLSLGDARRLETSTRVDYEVAVASKATMNTKYSGVTNTAMLQSIKTAVEADSTVQSALTAAEGDMADATVDMGTVAVDDSRAPAWGLALVAAAVLA
jgi:hypothetical protein